MGKSSQKFHLSISRPFQKITDVFRSAPKPPESAAAATIGRPTSRAAAKSPATRSPALPIRRGLPRNRGVVVHYVQRSFNGGLLSHKGGPSEHWPPGVNSAANIETSPSSARSSL